MAQYLKDNLKSKIIDAAKIEFVLKGYEKASMRAIARGAGMTAGNLYRYFKNKEQLYRYFVDPVFDKVSEFLEHNTRNHLGLAELPSSRISKYIKPKNAKKDIIFSVKKFSHFLAKMIKEYPFEFQLLIMDIKNYTVSDGTLRLYDWIENIIIYKIMIERNIRELSVAEKIFAQMLTNSFFEGLETFMREYKRGMDIEPLLFDFIMFYVRKYNTH